MTRTSTTSVISPATRNASPDSVIDALFKSMLAYYGNAWIDRWVGSDVAQVKAVWAAELADCTPQMIGAALNTLTGPFPPSLPEFRNLCRQFRPRPGSIANGSLVVIQDRRPPPAGVLDRIHKLVGKVTAEATAQRSSADRDTIMDDSLPVKPDGGADQ